MNPVAMLGYFFFRKSLENSGPSLSFARLCTSRHLADLQWIAFLIVVVAVIVLPVDIYFSQIDLLKDTKVPIASAIFAIAAAVLNWIYQSGNRRIGAVDLFACEISALCRVTLVVDFARSSVRVAQANEDTDRKPSPFSSQENYTPVYDKQLTELQSLDVNVVTRVTEFYTYRKTMMDYLRATAAMEDPAQRHGLRAQMIYMQFLMYESARYSVAELVEFEPNRAESIVNILCSEMVVYQFLTKFYASDYRGARLRLRAGEYHDVVPKLYQRITKPKHPGKNWQRALATAPEMLERYRDMCNEIGEPSKI